MDYTVILGEGRSGTNWLLDLLDSSETTHCRNEPNTLTESSPMVRLPNPFVPSPASDAVLERDWDEMIRWTFSHFGRRDPQITVPKAHIYELGRKIGLNRTMNRRPRQVLRKIIPCLRGGEWELPPWVGSRTRLSRAHPVIKLVQVPAWATWLLRNRPGARVAHIVRHPGGFLNSWRNRYLNKLGEPVVREANGNRLREIGAQFPDWAKRFGDIDAMSVIESELWYWRFSSETIFAVGNGRPNYHQLTYEQLAADPAAVARRVFEFAGIEWTDAVERRVTAVSHRADALACAWRSKMSATDVAAIDRVLAGSVMQDWWDHAAQPEPSDEPADTVTACGT